MQRGWQLAGQAACVDDGELLFAPEAFWHLRSHPDFRAVVESHCGANLAHYAGLDPMARWLVQDLGRASLSAAMIILDGFGAEADGGVSATTFIASVLGNGTCSRGRALAYLHTAEANGMIASAPIPVARDRRYVLQPRFLVPMIRFSQILLESVARLAPEVATGVAALNDAAFRRRFLRSVGLLTVSRPDLFAGPDRPVVLFIGRDGGSRMLEQLLSSQPPARAQMLDRAPLSRAAMARLSQTSRTHVRRMLQDGEAEGRLQVSSREITFTRELSEDVERHFALVFELARVSALSAMAG